jgi:hypothetical protein
MLPADKYVTGLSHRNHRHRGCQRRCRTSAAQTGDVEPRFAGDWSIERFVPFNNFVNESRGDIKFSQRNAAPCGMLRTPHSL